jgi:hypothetical protein
MPQPKCDTRDVSGDEGDRTPDLVNAIHALSQLSYVPKSVQRNHIQVFSAGTAKPIPGYIRSQAKRAGENIRGRYFAAPSVEQKVPAGSLIRRGLSIICEVMLRRVTAT